MIESACVWSQSHSQILQDCMAERFASPWKNDCRRHQRQHRHRLRDDWSSAWLPGQTPSAGKRLARTKANPDHVWGTTCGRSGRCRHGWSDSSRARDWRKPSRRLVLSRPIQQSGQLAVALSHHSERDLDADFRSPDALCSGFGRLQRQHKSSDL